MLNRRHFGVVVGAVLFGLLGACGTPTVEYHGSYPSYDGLDALYKRATLVIEAKVGPAKRVQELTPTLNGTDPRANPGAGVDTPTEVRPEDRVVVTVREASVARVFKGSAKPGDVVEVGQLGGEYRGVKYVQNEAVSLAADTVYILFLETFEGSPAALLNPTQGQYRRNAAGNFEALSGNEIRFTLDDLNRLTTAK